MLAHRRPCLLAAALLGTAHLVAPAGALADDWDDDWGDDSSSGGDDDWGDDDWGEEEEDDDGQPPVTAGGLYTKETWPLAELHRTLTLIEGMFESRLGVAMDLGNKTAFETWRGVVQGRYGLKDHFELRFGADFLLVGDAVPPFSDQAHFFFGFENAIIYDLLNFRLQGEIGLNPDGSDLDTIDDFRFDVSFGFPFRYRVTDKIGIIALDKLMTIRTSGKPDFTFGAGGIGQIADQFAVILQAEIIVPEFDFEQRPAIPATLFAQFTPNNRVDLGLAFTLANLNPPDGIGRLEQRALLLFVRPRF